MHPNLSVRLLIAATAFSLLTVYPSSQQAIQPQPATATRPADGVDPALFAGLRWRSIGPDRGGRSIAVGAAVLLLTRNFTPGRTRTMIRRRILLAAFVALALTSSAFAQLDPLPDIPKGTIAVNLQPVATGMAAPLYGISPPGDTSRLFVLEQNGLVRILENGALLPGAALDLQSRVSPPLAAEELYRDPQ